MSKPYVHSGYDRIAADNYQTIDARCVEALMATWPIAGKIVDVCSPMGSGIVEHMNDMGGVIASGAEDAFAPVDADWIITNPPYDRRLVDKIVSAQVERVRRGEVQGFATLMRSNWDYAKGRASLFDNRLYAGETKMRFRPWWSEDKTASPIHNFSWHVWHRMATGDPVKRYWPKD